MGASTATGQLLPSEKVQFRFISRLST